MKLLLTSAGFENKNVKAAFLEIIHKPLSELKLIFIPTASRFKEEIVYVQKSKEELLSFGILEKNIKTVHLDHKISYNKVKDYDCVYVCGGNTFYLLDQIRKTGFDKILKDYLKEDKCYVGVSAGSIIMSPDISIAGIGETGDENDVGLKDVRGLHFIDVILTPHYVESEKKFIEEYRKKSKYKLITLTDKQAFLVIDNKTKIIN